MDKSQWQQDYLDHKTNDCPGCGRDNPEHTCNNCFSGIGQDTCWKNGGHCDSCSTHIREELPKLRQKKIDMGIACRCDEPQCAKCLSANCKDDNCITHTSADKMRHRARLANVEQITGPEFKLYDALKKLGVDAVLHYPDGYKTVDIAVLPAKLYIEVDGIQHFNSPRQIEQDFKRSHYSAESGFATFYVTNQIVESKYLDEVAIAIAEVVRRRINNFFR